jgi:hypothetical protein
VQFLPLSATLREWCCLIDRRLKTTETLQAEALELYAELCEFTLEQLASE